MKIEFTVSLEKENDLWNLFLEKKLELEFLPNEEEIIEDNGLYFKVEYRIFNLEGYVKLHLKQDFKIESDIDKNDVLKRMKQSGWTYRDDPNFDILEM